MRSDISSRAPQRRSGCLLDATRMNALQPESGRTRHCIADKVSFRQCSSATPSSSATPKSGLPDFGRLKVLEIGNTRFRRGDATHPCTISAIGTFRSAGLRPRLGAPPVRKGLPPSSAAAVGFHPIRRKRWQRQNAHDEVMAQKVLMACLMNREPPARYGYRRPTMVNDLLRGVPDRPSASPRVGSRRRLRRADRR
jgi:hypothetical protein